MINSRRRDLIEKRVEQTTGRKVRVYVNEANYDVLKMVLSRPRITRKTKLPDYQG